MSNVKTLAELSAASGIPARTIRFYIARGLLAGPAKAGRAAAYSDEHLARLEAIKELQASGKMLAEIAHDLSDLSTSAENVIPPSPWWQHAIDKDVMVWVKGDLSPWRMKHIRAAVEDLASRLRELDGNDENKGEKEK